MKAFAVLAVLAACGCGNPAVEKAYQELLLDKEDQIKAGVEKRAGAALRDAEERAAAAESRIKELETIIAAQKRTELAPAASAPNKTPADDWRDAFAGVEQDGVRVSVTGASIGTIVVKQFGREGEVPERMLKIYIQIQNLSETKKVRYRSWGHFSMSSGEIGAASDELGNSYTPMGSLGTEIVGQREKESIYPGKSLSDLLVYEIPIDAAKEIRLALPAGNFGGSGMLRLRIPREKL